MELVKALQQTLGIINIKSAQYLAMHCICIVLHCAVLRLDPRVDQVTPAWTAI